MNPHWEPLLSDGESPTTRKANKQLVSIYIHSLIVYIILQEVFLSRLAILLMISKMKHKVLIAPIGLIFTCVHVSSPSCQYLGTIKLALISNSLFRTQFML